MGVWGRVDEASSVRFMRARGGPRPRRDRHLNGRLRGCRVQPGGIESDSRDLPTITDWCDPAAVTSRPIPLPPSTMSTAVLRQAAIAVCPIQLFWGRGACAESIFGGGNRLVRFRASAPSPRRPSRGKVRAAAVSVARFAGPNEPSLLCYATPFIPTRLERLFGNADLVQDLYIKELKAYKAPAPVRDIFLHLHPRPQPRFIPNPTPIFLFSPWMLS